MRSFWKRNGYSAWNISIEDFPREGSFEEQAKFFVRYAILAPSSHNTQPWIFKFFKPTAQFEIFLELNKKYLLPASDSTGRQAWISIGAALENFIVAANFFGFEAAPDFDAQNRRVRILIEKKGEGPINDSQTLFNNIKKRHSARVPYSEKLPPQSVLDYLRVNAEQKFGNVNITWIKDMAVIEKAAVLAGEGILHAFSMREFRDELGKWLKPSTRDVYDGMPGFTVGMPLLVSFLAPLIMGKINMGPMQKVMIEKLIKSTPVIGIIGGEDRFECWVNAGRMYMRSALELLNHGIVTSVFAAPVEFDEIALKLKETIGVQKRPLIFFRVGFTDKKFAPGPRRQIKDAISD